MASGHHERIRELGTAVGMDSEAILDAVKLFDAVYESNLTTPYKRVVPTVLLLAADRKRSPRSVDEVAAECENDRNELIKTKKTIKNELGLDLPPTDPEDVLPPIFEELGLSPDVSEQAREYVKRTKEEGHVSGKDPYAIAAAATYTASQFSGEGLNQRKVSDAADTSEVSIRTRQREVLDAAAPSIAQSVDADLDESTLQRIRNIFRWALTHEELKPKSTSTILAGTYMYVLKQEGREGLTPVIAETIGVGKSPIEDVVEILSNLSEQLPDQEQSVAFPQSESGGNAGQKSSVQGAKETSPRNFPPSLTAYETTTTQRHLDTAFRKEILERYGWECLLTDIDDPRLLDVAHIIPRSEREDIAADPANVTVLSKTLHAAFDRGLFTLTQHLEVVVYPKLSTESRNLRELLIARDEEKITLPEAASLSTDYLQERNRNISWFDPPSDD